MFSWFLLRLRKRNPLVCFTYCYFEIGEELVLVLVSGFFSPNLKPNEVIWQEKTSMEKILPPGWPVVHILD